MVISNREGFFVPESQHDILIEAIRKKEHGGRVRDYGDDIDLKVWFGPSRKSTKPVQKETLEEFKRNLESQKKEFAYLLAVEQKNCRKDMEELYAVCGNILISKIYDIILC